MCQRDEILRKAPIYRHCERSEAIWLSEADQIVRHSKTRLSGVTSSHGLSELRGCLA